MPSRVEQMKWWGWGDQSFQFPMSNKPALWPYIESAVGADGDLPHTPPIDFKDINLPPLNQHAGFLKDVKVKLRDDQVTDDKLDRLVHAFGKSFRDLWRVRNGIVKAAPDCVIYPESEEQVQLVVRAATHHEVSLIPFGGGSNIVGCLEAISTRGRMIVSLDMKRMNRVLSVDDQSRTARIQAGVLGPDMEIQLEQFGVTLGHFPDSFEYSTLGGWIATRSAGMQSDKYGKIEDMVIALRMVTPSGTIVTRTVPKSANGIDVRHMCIGSEGILGVITEATMQVHRRAPIKQFYGYLFPDFDRGAAAISQTVHHDGAPVVTRLNDAAKTALSFAYATKSPRLKAMLAKSMKMYRRRFKRIDFGRCCLMIIAFEGDRHQCHAHRRRVHAIYRKFGGCSLGASPGKAFERGKYDFPHLRDVVMDRGIMADVSETSTVWSKLMPLYHAATDQLATAISATGHDPFMGCHISHTYHTGASLYFTFACKQNVGQEIKQYLYIKKAAEDAFLQNGATLSHHHAIGSEHLPWVQADISATGVLAVKALKNGLDPGGIMNPGKLIPSDDPLKTWGLTDADAKPFSSGGTASCSAEKPSS
jgi:alkyldihydroxyacetonephosphate synthase